MLARIAAGAAGVALAVTVLVGASTSVTASAELAGPVLESPGCFMCPDPGFNPN